MSEQPYQRYPYLQQPPPSGQPMNQQPQPAYQIPTGIPQLANQANNYFAQNVNPMFNRGMRNSILHDNAQEMVWTHGPQTVECYACQRQVVTNIKRKPGVLSVVCCIILFFIFWPISCLSFCIPYCMDTTHYCSNCQAYLGKSAPCSRFR